jgi:multimeric flavodoxin WrbA
MEKYVWEEAAKDFMEKFLNFPAKIVQPVWRDRIVEECYRIAASKGVENISKEIVIQAVRDRIPPDYEPVIQMTADPEGFKKEFMSMFEDKDFYEKIPIEINRWDSPFRHEKVKPDTKPEEATVMAFCASPRKGGNTDILIDEALKGAKSVGAKTEKFYLQDLKMGFCIGCRKCKDKILPTTCVVKDDLTPIYKKIQEAHFFIIGFPIYTSRESAQLAVFFDRWDCFEGPGLKNTLKLSKRAMVIGTWGYPKIDTYNHHIMRAIGTLNVHQIQTVEAISASGFEGVLHGLDKDKKGVVLRNPEGLKEVFEAGKCLITG